MKHLLRGGALRPIFLSLLIVFLAFDCHAAASQANPYAIEHRFQTGLDTIERGEPQVAIRIFREILAKHPSLIRVRLELARAYYKSGEWDQSRQAFFEVLSGDLPLGVRRTILKFLSAINARSGFDWTARFGIGFFHDSSRQYDSNRINLRFGEQILPFRIERRDPPSSVAIFEGNAEIRERLFEDKQIVVVGFGDARISADEGPGVNGDDYFGELRVGSRLISGNTTGLAATFASARRVYNERFEERVGIQLGGSTRLARGTRFFTNGRLALVNNTNDNRDGIIASYNIGVAQSLYGRGSIGFSIRAERGSLDEDYESYNEFGASVFGTFDLGFGLNIFSRSEIATRKYDEIPPLFLEHINEIKYGVSLKLSKSDLFLFGNFSPFLEAEYSRVSNNVPAFSYREIQLKIGVERIF